MKKTKGGFTLIEVSLFLAITGLLFLGVTIGVQNSIFQQRYNDSVQSFVEFLRSAYSKTENVQGKADGGNSSRAIYGKLITFGEQNGFNGANSDGEIFMYDVIGAADCGGGASGTLTALKNCEVDVIRDGKLLGQAESYKPKWSAAVQATGDGADLYKGAILIVRNPKSGTIYTYVKKTSGTINVNQGTGLNSLLTSTNFDFMDVDFCVNPNGNVAGSAIRANVRIHSGARNSSGIETMPDDENLCASRG